MGAGGSHGDTPKKCRLQCAVHPPEAARMRMKKRRFTIVWPRANDILLYTTLLAGDNRKIGPTRHTAHRSRRCEEFGSHDGTRARARQDRKNGPERREMEAKSIVYKNRLLTRK